MLRILALLLLPKMLVPAFSGATVAVERKNKTVVVAVIDTGFNPAKSGAILCRLGHADFSVTPPVYRKVPNDDHGHGTNVSDIISQKTVGAGGGKYCLVIIKFFSVKATSDQNVAASIQSLKHVHKLNADMVNYSGGGPVYNPTESAIVKGLLNKGITFVAAAGNESKNLETDPFFPAMYDQRIVVVGNITEQGVVEKSSNFGRSVTAWEVGTNVEGGTYKMTGTSQATAVRTGKIVRKLMIDRFK